MIAYVKITVAGIDTYLQEVEPGRWIKLVTAPTIAGTYNAVLSVIKDNGLMTVYTNTDESIAGLLEIIVSDGSIAGNRMMDYLPPYWHPNLEMQQILQSEGFAIDTLLLELQRIYTDAYIMTASAERIAEWEEDLEIVPNGTLEQRRLFVLSKIRGFGKLNEHKIQNIVASFTAGGAAIVTFANSTINVKVLPPQNGETFLFPDIERTLKPMIPAHLGLVIERYYSTWQDIKDKFDDWQDVYDHNTSWNAVRNFIERV